MIPKIIAVITMNGRHKTVDYCANKMPWLHKVYVVSEPEDYHFILKYPNTTVISHKNNPLSAKWQSGVFHLKNLDFDAVMILGSDDWMTFETYQFICNKISEGHDFVGFTDCYFRNDDIDYYWSGYRKKDRKFEPIGAGRTISKSALISMNWILFPELLDESLDRTSWPQIVRHTKNRYKTKLKDHNLYMVDIKDEESMNSISVIPNLINEGLTKFL
jgi:hypothetical protein